MKIRKVLLLITALAVLLTLSACRREKYYVSSEALETVMSDELYFGVPDYIVRGTVTKMVEEYFTAPDGPSYENAHVTVYELEITESYKGTLSEETVLLKIINGGGLSVNMYLYGEDGDYILEEPVDIFSLEPGQEYLLGLGVLNPEKFQTYGETEGYVVRLGKHWALMDRGDGVYQSMVSPEDLNYHEFTIETLAKKLALLP
ncbi:MAG: hypothetical protein DBX52_06930 [Clostridiales bacterium]|nr:MAG: hypothetical protein DBX52_06930 [Clostridiales bacterium]